MGAVYSTKGHAVGTAGTLSLIDVVLVIKAVGGNDFRR